MHDCLDVVKDLCQLLAQIATEKLGVQAVDEADILFVANSIGCAFACLYAQGYPGSVAGMYCLILSSQTRTLCRSSRTLMLLSSIKL
ncbi:hypothetical protein BDW67DRAFT_154069 [Aspergillus spinulosporus]